jgi:RHS repeat-associated protein
VSLTSSTARRFLTVVVTVALVVSAAAPAGAATPTDGPSAGTAAGGLSFGYDSGGNMTSRTVAGGTESISWDPSARPVGFTGPGYATTISYDADGNRVIRAGGGNVMVTGDGWEWTTSGGFSSYYTLGEERVGLGTGWGWWWMHTDPQNSTATLAPPSGAATHSYWYPYGLLRGVNGPAAATEVGYTGKRSDPNGLIDFPARLYHPQVGRFISPDPLIPTLESGGDFNRYSYTRNNPTTLTDPSGHIPEDLQEAVSWLKDFYGANLRSRYQLANYPLWVPRATFNLATVAAEGFLGPQNVQLLLGYSPARNLVDSFTRHYQAIAAGILTGDPQAFGQAWFEVQTLALGYGLGKAITATRAATLGRTATNTALQFADDGVRGFGSMSSFRRAYGSAGPNAQWHHIVEQTPGNVTRFGATSIHNTSNIVRLETGIHRQVSGYYSSVQPFTGGQTVRQWLSTQSFDAQMQFGIDVLKQFGAAG